MPDDLAIKCPYCGWSVVVVRNPIPGSPQFGTEGNIACASPESQGCDASWDYLGRPLTPRDGTGLVLSSDKVVYLAAPDHIVKRTAYLDCVDSWGNAWGEEKHSGEPVHLWWDGEHWLEVPASS